MAQSVGQGSACSTSPLSSGPFMFGLRQWKLQLQHPRPVPRVLLPRPPWGSLASVSIAVDLVSTCSVLAWFFVLFCFVTTAFTELELIDHAIHPLKVCS